MWSCTRLVWKTCTPAMRSGPTLRFSRRTRLLLMIGGQSCRRCSRYTSRHQIMRGIGLRIVRAAPRSPKLWSTSQWSSRLSRAELHLNPVPCRPSMMCCWSDN